jgi:hypothetical protein
MLKPQQEHIMQLLSLVVPDQVTFTLDSAMLLKTYIQTVLAETRTNHYEPQVALEMMNRAWTAQKILWNIQEQSEL